MSDANAYADHFIILTMLVAVPDDRLMAIDVLEGSRVAPDIAEVSGCSNLRLMLSSLGASKLGGQLARRTTGSVHLSVLMVAGQTDTFVVSSSVGGLEGLLAGYLTSPSMYLVLWFMVVDVDA
jgi:hypothetical protein